MSNIKPCKYGCGVYIIYLGKTGEPKSTGMFEVIDGKITKREHTYAICEALLKKQKEEKEAIEKTKAAHGGGLEAFT